MCLWSWWDHSISNAWRPQFPLCVPRVVCISTQALQKGIDLCWFLRKSVRTSSIMFPSQQHFPVFCICTWYGEMHFSPGLLFPWSLLSTLPRSLCLSNQSNTSSLDFGPSSPSRIIPSLELSSPGWPACRKRCFCPTWSNWFYVFLATLDPKRVS